MASSFLLKGVKTISRENKTKSFNAVPYVCGGIVVALVCAVVIFVEIKTGNAKSLFEGKPSAAESETISITEAPTQPETMAENEFSGEAPKQATQKTTEKVTENTTQSPTQKATEKPKEKATQSPATPTEPPPALTENQPVAEPPAPVIITPQPQQPATIYAAPTPSENDIYLSPNVVYLKVGEQATISVVYPPGLATQGESWDLDNNTIVGFGAVNVGSAVINAKAVGTAYIHAYPKGTNRTLTCTIIVQ